MQDLHDIYDFCVTLYSKYGPLAILGLLIFIEYKYRPLYKLYKLSDMVSENNKMHQQIREDLTSVKTQTAKEVSEIRQLLLKEFSHNGGLSIKDALRRTEETVNLLVAQQNISLDLHDKGIFMCDGEGRNFFVNKKYAEMLDCDKSELLNYGWQNFIVNLPEYNVAYQQAFNVNRVFNATTIMTTSDNEKLQCRIEAYPLNSISGYMGYINPVDS